MKKIQVTRQLIRTFKRFHRSPYAPQKPYCKICSIIVRIQGKGSISTLRSTINYFKEGEEVYEVTYANGHIGLYHTDCIDHPTVKTRDKVEEILRYDRDRWTDIGSVVTQLQTEGTPTSKIVRELQTRFKCSRATAYRVVAQACSKIS